MGHGEILIMQDVVRVNLGGRET